MTLMSELLLLGKARELYKYPEVVKSQSLQKEVHSVLIIFSGK